MQDINEINVALVGCGEHAREVILPTLLTTPGIRIGVLCDNNDDRIGLARAFCHDVQTTTSFEMACANASIEAVVVVATPQVHAQVAKLALLAKKHVFVEKPMAFDAAGAHALAALAESSGCVTMVGHNFRFAPAFARIRGVMADPAFGKPTLAEIRYFASKPRGDRWGLNSADRSFLLSHGSHALDIAVDLLGESVHVEHSVLRRRKDGLFAAITLVTPDGSSCSLTMTNAAPHFDIGATVIGSNGTMVQMESLRQVRNFGDSDHFKRIGNVWIPPVISSGFVQAGYSGEFDSFFQAIRCTGVAPSSFADAVRVSDLIEDILKDTAILG